MDLDRVNGIMENIRHLIQKFTRQSSPICRQMELPLPGSRLTRAEANFLREVRQIRAQLAASQKRAGSV